MAPLYDVPAAPLEDAPAMPLPPQRRVEEAVGVGERRHNALAAARG